MGKGEDEAMRGYWDLGKGTSCKLTIERIIKLNDFLIAIKLKKTIKKYRDAASSPAAIFWIPLWL